MGKRILTNKFGLPETLVKAVQYDTHRNTGTISVTTLIDGPQIRHLKSLHDYESDVIDNIYALVGTALHHILERANINSIRQRAFILTAETLISEAEKRASTDGDGAMRMKNAANWIFSVIPVIFPELENRYIFERNLRLDLKGGHVLSGTFDLYDKTTGILYDYKFCSTYAWTFPESRNKWVEQTNIYAYMLMQEGLPVNEIRIVAFFRNWDEHALMRNKDYPKKQIMEIPIAVRPAEKIRALIDYYIDQHIQAEQGNVPECSGAVRWAKADVYAIMTKTGKKSIMNLDSEAAAVRFIQENGHRYTEPRIEHRPGGSLRCQKYCPVNKFCPQYKMEIEREEILKK